MSKTTGVAAHVASVVFVVFLVLAAGPAAGTPADHDHPAPEPTSQVDPHAGHGSTGGHAGDGMPTVDPPTSGVAHDTRLAVLGAFGAVNAAAVLGALALRRTGHGRRPRVAR